jgi:hypothetical protein
VRLKRAEFPSAVLPFGYPPSGAGVTACPVGESANEASNGTTSKDKALVFICGKLCLFCSLHGNDKVI